ncbi:MAG: class A sortase [Tissierellia bacterium]|nr:class A sortase [Tissierellia bacterium]
MNRKIVKRAIGTLLIIGGSLFILSYFAREWVVEKKVAETTKNYSLLNRKELKINNEKDVAFKNEEIEDISIFTGLKSSLEDVSGNIVGKIVIPSLDIDLPLLKGTTNANLHAGATTMRDDQRPGEGNYPIAGHIMPNKRLLFGSLMDISNGAMVYITDKERVYEYQIYETELVPDTAMYMIEDKRARLEGSPIVSLMTCYYSSKSGKRFFATGRLVRNFPIEDIDKFLSVEVKGELE